MPGFGSAASAGAGIATAALSGDSPSTAGGLRCCGRRRGHAATQRFEARRREFVRGVEEDHPLEKFGAAGVVVRSQGHFGEVLEGDQIVRIERQDAGECLARLGRPPASTWHRARITSAET